MSYRSLFHRSLDVLTCIYNDETDIEAICEKVQLGTNHVEDLLSKLMEWELLDELSPILKVSDRGKNVLSFYHNYSVALNANPLIRATIPDY